MWIGGFVLHLTSEEEKAYNGEYGPLKEWAMKFLTKFGDAFDAEKLIEISGAYGVGPTPQLKDLNPAAYEEMMKKEYKFPVPSCTHFRGFGEHEFVLETGCKPVPPEQLRRDGEMGIYLTGTCAPYLVGWNPPFGSHVASTESSCIVYLNSVLGVRTHKHTFPSLQASCVMGKTPFFGLHTDEGRKGKLLVKVETTLKNSSDYAALGWYAGDVAGIDVPVFTGIPSGKVSQYEHMALGASMASTGGVGMYHVVGVTPEAPSLEKALGGDKPEETISFGEEELKKTCEDMTTPGSKEVDCVVLGCPHLSITEMMKVAELVKGKTVNDRVRFWLLTSPIIIWQAEMMGTADIIKAAGGRIVVSCFHTIGHPTPEVFAVNSGKACFYLRGDFPKAAIWFGYMEKCVEAALTGEWR
jgi:predicted aconitase